MQQLIIRGQQLQAEEGLVETLQQDLQSLDNTISKMEQNMDSQEQSLEVNNVSYQVMESLLGYVVFDKHHLKICMLISVSCVLILYIYIYMFFVFFQ